MRRLVIVGATGIIGNALIEALEQHRLKKKLDNGKSTEYYKLALYASRDYCDFYDNYKVVKYSDDQLLKNDIVVFCTSNEISKKNVYTALQYADIVIDTSSVYRLKSGIPMIHSATNLDAISKVNQRLIVTPNCLVSSILDPLYLIHKNLGIRSLTMTTMQSASGAGCNPVKELVKETDRINFGFKDTCDEKKAALTERYYKATQITGLGEANKRMQAYNITPQIGDCEEFGSSGEEKKIVNELLYLLRADFPVSVTAFRTPTIIGHIASCDMQLSKKVENVEAIRDLLDSNKDIRYREAKNFPSNHELFKENHIAYVSRIRLLNKNKLQCVISANNLVKGTVWNVIRILENLRDL
jgi:aspartate-semialdehyde dehydrogenase